MKISTAFRNVSIAARAGFLVSKNKIDAQPAAVMTIANGGAPDTEPTTIFNGGLPDTEPARILNGGTP